jgi:phosphate-selective porin OprO/OprP
MSRRPAWCLVVVIALMTSVSAAATDAPAPPAPNPLAERLGLAPKAEPPPVEVPAPAEPAAPPAPNPLAERLRPTIELRGRIEADAVMATQSAASRAIIGDLQNGYGFRRARIGAQGRIGTSALWVAEIDFANGNFRARDLYVGLISLPLVQEVKVGYFREPYSLEGSTSSRYITFMERSPLNQFDPARNWGVAGYWWPENERMLFEIGAFRTGTNNGGFSGGDNPNWAVSTRLTGLPVYEDGEGGYRLVHIGAAFSQRRPPNGVVQYRPDAQSNLLDVADSPASPFLPTVTIPSNSQQLFNLQAAAVYGPLSVQGEWFATTVQQLDAGMVFLHGFYVYASYFLTGEHRGYDRRVGGFGPVSVHRPLIRLGHSGATGCGAVELAARFSVADLSSPNLPVSPTPVGSPTGTVLYQSTFGVNWYLNDYTRLMVNYVLSVPAARGFPALPVHGFGIRTAIYW